MRLQTEWNVGCVNAVVSGEREIIGLDRQPYGVGEQSMTGGPVLRGPWGSIGGMQSQWSEYETRCKQLIAANIHGQLVAKRQQCEAYETCIGFDTLGYCQRCGGEKR